MGAMDIFDKLVSRKDRLENYAATGELEPYKKKQEKAKKTTKPKIAVKAKKEDENLTSDSFAMNGKKIKTYVPRYGASTKKKKEKPMTKAERRAAAMNRK